jgi:AraC-like DNA-binding protein
MENSLFQQLIVLLNRMYAGVGSVEPEPEDMEYDKTVGSIIDYINSHLEEELSIDSMAERHFISRYYLMHTFKKHTGYSLHNYILQKRLIRAGELVKGGMPATEASLKSGFSDYSNFVRAFKKMYGLSPREFCKSSQRQEQSEEKNSHFRQ